LLIKIFDLKLFQQIYEVLTSWIVCKNGFVELLTEAVDISIAVSKALISKEVFN